MFHPVFYSIVIIYTYNNTRPCIIKIIDCWWSPDAGSSWRTCWRHPRWCSRVPGSWYHTVPPSGQSSGRETPWPGSLSSSSPSPGSLSLVPWLLLLSSLVINYLWWSTDISLKFSQVSFLHLKHLWIKLFFCIPHETKTNFLFTLSTNRIQC